MPNFWSRRNKKMNDDVNLRSSASRAANRRELFGPPALPLLYGIPLWMAVPLLRKHCA
jgi:hypothetical protein